MVVAMNELLLRLPRCQPAISSSNRARRSRIQHVCQAAYFPHYRVHYRSDGTSIPNTAGNVAARYSPDLLSQLLGPGNNSVDELAGLLHPLQLQQACRSLVESLQSRLEAVFRAVTAAYHQAQTVWQYVCVSWPAWQISLCEDIEFLVEYTVGLLSAWLITMYTALRRLYVTMLSAPRVQRVLAVASDSVAELTNSLKQLRHVVAAAQQGTRHRLVDSPPLQHLIGLVSRTPSSASRTSQLVSSLTHSMAALSMADLALHIPGRGSNRNRHSNTETVDSADSRARLLGDASFDSAGKWTELCSAANSRYQAATSGLQQVVVEPLQHAGFIAADGRSPTVAGVIAAGSVLLAGSVYRSMQQNAQDAEERMLQQVQLQLKAESLAAQRARFRRALGDAQTATGGAAAAGTRRRSSSPIDDDAWEDNSPASPLAPAGQSVRGTGMLQNMTPRLDAEAAREYQKFMAGAKAMDVPMWDSHMVEELPKVSMKELQRQTQKIRSAATAEERAAMEDAETRRQMVEQQLNSQLQELSGAPVGRAAREAWRKEQQQRRLQEQQAQAKKPAAGGDSRSNSRSGSRAGSDSNPFAISKEARAKWEADDHLYTDAKPKAKSSTGWGFGLSGASQQQKQQQPQQSVSQQVRQRRFADVGVGGAAAGAPAERSSRSGSSTPQGNASGAAVTTLSTKSPAAATADQQRMRSAADTTAAAAGVAAVDGPAEGSPEWEAKMREEMMRSGAARRARRQQMQQQQQGMQGNKVTAAAAPNVADTASTLQVSQANSAAAGGGTAAAVPAAANSSGIASGAVTSTTTAAVSAREPPEQSVHQPQRGPGAAGTTTDKANQVDSHSRLTVLGKIDARDRSNTRTSGDSLSVVSARDAQDITAQPPAPSPVDMQRMDTAAAGRAEAAAEARAAAVRTPERPEAVEQGEDAGRNPFAMDKDDVLKDDVLNDDTAFELGKQVDKETMRIKWRTMMQ